MELTDVNLNFPLMSKFVDSPLSQSKNGLVENEERALGKLQGTLVGRYHGVCGGSTLKRGHLRLASVTRYG